MSDVKKNELKKYGEFKEQTRLVQTLSRYANETSYFAAFKRMAI